MTTPADRAATSRTKRLWSLTASRRAHGGFDEIEGIEPRVNRASWLLLALILAYAVLIREQLPAHAVTLLWGGAIAYAATLVALHLRESDDLAKPWPMLARCWAIIAYITSVLWALRVDTGALVTLYHLAVIVSAATLSRRFTLLNLVLIGICLTVLSHPSVSGKPQSAATALWLFAQLAPMLLVAYVVSDIARAIRRALERIRFVSETDELTALYNLRAFMKIAERFHRQAKRYDRSYSLVMLDSDNLKSVNDTHGHQCGNDLLKLTTACIRRELRETDVAARYGGDEFILLLPETSISGARELAERIRRSVETKHLDVRGQQVRTSVSIGVAGFPVHGTDLQSILNKSDQAMYLAKRTGRNRVVLFDPG